MRLSSKLEPMLLLVVAVALLFFPYGDVRSQGQKTQTQKTLDVYYLDLEGDGGTLIVTPDGESLLIDTGLPGDRDADRITAAAKQAGIKQLDYVLITHYDGDHVGGTKDIASRFPIGNFVDYGPTDTPPPSGAGKGYQAYVEFRDQQKAKHILVKPGDKLPLRGLDITVVSAGGAVLTRPLPGAGAPNPLCAGFTPRAGAIQFNGEDPHSIGLFFRYGAFRTMQLGDLAWNKEHELACPKNLIGTVDEYLASTHGLSLSSPPALVHALRPRVIVIDNGPTKGSRDTWVTAKSSPGLEGLWTVHYAVERPADPRFLESTDQGGKEQNVPEEFIANLDTTTSYFLKLSARKDGSFVLTNSRTGYSKEYKGHR
jgi:competence protein ComEC